MDPFLLNYVGKHSFDFNFEKSSRSVTIILLENMIFIICSKNSSVEDKVRTIYSLTMEKDPVNPNIVNFEITGNGFLYNMVRINYRNYTKMLRLANMKRNI